MAFLRNILFCLLDILLQRYDTSKFEKKTFFTKSAAVHNFYIANSPGNLYLNYIKEYFILSVSHFLAKI